MGVLKGLLYAVGGHDGPLVRKSCEVYDPVSSTWKQVADMNMCRRNAGKLDTGSFTPLTLRTRTVKTYFGYQSFLQGFLVSCCATAFYNTMSSINVKSVLKYII